MTSLLLHEYQMMMVAITPLTYMQCHKVTHLASLLLLPSLLFPRLVNSCFQIHTGQMFFKLHLDKAFGTAYREIVRCSVLSKSEGSLYVSRRT